MLYHYQYTTNTIRNKNYGKISQTRDENSQESVLRKCLLKNISTPSILFYAYKKISFDPHNHYLCKFRLSKAQSLIKNT